MRCAFRILFWAVLWSMTLPAVAGITLTPASDAYLCVSDALSVSAKTSCEAGGIDVDIDNGTIVQTGGDGKYEWKGTFTANSTPGDSVFSASDDCNNSKSVTIHVLKISHTCQASAPADRSRTTIGVGEYVDLSLGSAVNATWVPSAGSVSPTTGGGTTFTAPETGGNATVTVTFPGGHTCSLNFTVVAPSYITVVKRSATEYVNYLGIDMWVDFYIGPENVNFSSIYVGEDTCTANCTGYFTYQQGEVHHPGADALVSSTLVPGWGWKMNNGDHPVAGTRGPTYTTGSFIWHIPVHYTINWNSYPFTSVDHEKTLSIGGNGKATLTLKKQPTATDSVTEP